ncbi:MAG TPA: hypothetical protein VGX23_31495 [Actinocrinis sp.]|nr:hypothetical protein [Actinocrinis sp.]
MFRNPVAKATGAASIAAIIVLIVVAGLGNQALENWRATQITSGNGWLVDVVRPLELAGWRFSAVNGESTAQWVAPLLFNIAFLILTFFLVDISARDAGHVSLLFGTWSAVTLAGGGAGLICTPLAFQGVGSPASENYATTLTSGLVLGFLVGIIAAVVAGLIASPRGEKVVNGSIPMSGGMM